MSNTLVVALTFTRLTHVRDGGQLSRTGVIVSRQKSEGFMGIAENKQVVRNFYDAAARGDMEACFALLANDVKWTNIGTTKFSGTYTGKQVLLEQLLRPLFGQLKSGISTVVENLIAEADVVVAQTTGSAETHDGVPYNNSYCQVMRIREGKIVEVKEYFDTQLTSSVFGSS
jgi:ketosteroid isomerase-like protein